MDHRESTLPLLAAIVEHSEDAIISASLSGVIDSWNAGAQHIFGYTAATAVGRPVTTFVPIEFRSNWEISVRRLKEGALAERFETVHVTELGQRTHLWTMSLLKDPTIGIVGVCAVGRDISQAKNLEAALCEIEQRFRFATQAGRMFSYVWNAVTDVLIRDQEAAEILGLTGDVTHTTGQQVMATIHPDDRHRIIDAIAGLNRDNPVYRATARILRPDGGVIWLERTGRGFFSAEGKLLRLIGMAVDITERMRSEETLRESEEKFRSVFRDAGVGILLVSPEKRFLAANSAFCEHLGYSEQELLNQSLESLIYVNDWPLVSRALDNVLTTARSLHKLENRCIHKSGRTVWAEASASVIRGPNGEAKYFIVEAVDVTERKLAAEALSSLNRRLVQGQEQERTRIARELHDDISQSLTVLIIRLQEMRKMAPASPAELSARIDALINHAAEISGNVRSLSHGLHTSKIEYLGIIKAMASFCKEYAAHHGVEIQFSHEGVRSDIPAEISLCLFRVLQEALQNAVKYSGVHHFDVRLSGTTGDIALRVSDTGVGFDPETAMNQSGLGLISMRERLRMVEGAFSVTSKPNEGTTIHAHVQLSSKLKSGASG